MGTSLLERLEDLVELLLEDLGSPLGITELINTEEANTERFKALRFITHEGDTTSNLHALLLELGDHGIRLRVVYNNSGCLESLSSSRREAVLLHDLANKATELTGVSRGSLKTKGVTKLEHDLVEAGNGVSRHGAVVHEATSLVLVHAREPLVKADTETGALSGLGDLTSLIVHAHDTTAGRARPTLLGSSDENIYTEVLHVGPKGASSDSIKDEETSNLVNSGSDLLDVLIVEKNTGRGLNVRCEDNSGLLGLDLLDNLVNRGRGHRGLHGGVLHASLEDCLRLRDLADIEDVAPAEAEETLTKDHDVLVSGELTGHRFHGVAAGARNDGSVLAVVDLLKSSGNFAHHLLERLAHLVDGAVGVHDGELHQVAAVVLQKRTGLLGVNDISRGRVGGAHGAS
mmetsp:Transcript_757/g.1783  ORF Transcript_757/g.1783 Transcript_757/m.1783 type:complete len:402 (+) Transcript_757:464-1669(+)